MNLDEASLSVRLQIKREGYSTEAVFKIGPVLCTQSKDHNTNRISLYPRTLRDRYPSPI